MGGRNRKIELHWKKTLNRFIFWRNRDNNGEKPKLDYIFFGENFFLCDL